MNETFKHRNAIFVSLILACILASLSYNAFVTAYSPIMYDFNITADTVQWLSSIYSLVSGIMILSTPFLIHRFKTKPLFLFFLGLFIVGLIMSALAINFEMILVGRIFQALAYGVFLNLCQVIIMTIYPSEKHGTMMGIYSFAVCVIPIIAPTATGVLIDYFGWRIVFVIIAIIAVFIFMYTTIVMQNILEIKSEKFDIVSFLLCAIGFTGIIVGIGNAGSNIFSLETVIPFVLGLVILACFVYKQLHSNSPFLNLKGFKDKQYIIAVISSVILYASLQGIGTLLPIYIQTYRGFSATISGFTTMPGAIIMSICSIIAGKVFDRYGIKKLFLLSSIMILIAGAGFSFLDSETPIVYIAFIYALRSAAVGLIIMNLVIWGIKRLSNDILADSMAILNSLRTLSGAIGAAGFVSIMSAVSDSSDTLSCIRGIDISFTIASICIAFIVGLAIYVCIKLEN